MAEGPPIPPSGGEANQGIGFTPQEQPGQQSADNTQRFDAEEVAVALENAGLHTLAENMRQPTESDEEIRQRQIQEKEARFAEENARWKAEAARKQPEISQPEDQTRRFDLDYAELQRLAEKLSSS